MNKSVYIYCISELNPIYISFQCAVFIQGLYQLGGFSISANFDNTVNIACNNSIGVPSLDGIRIEKSDNFFGSEVIIIDDKTTRGAYPGNQQFWNFILRLSKSRYIAVLNGTDGANAARYPEERFNIFTAHHSTSFVRQPNTKSLPFGYAVELLKEAEDFEEIQVDSKNNVILYNFGHSLNQSVRQAAAFSIVPAFESSFAINRDYSRGKEYISQLTTSAGIFVYGGTFIWRLDDSLKESSKVAYDSSDGHFKAEVAVVRWDSWRFWEACIFECAPITLDFQIYGFSLPVLPVPWEEYIPLDFANPMSTVLTLKEKVKADENYLHQVGQNAKLWAISNYSPAQQAKRILGLLS